MKVNSNILMFRSCRHFLNIFFDYMFLRFVPYIFTFFMKYDFKQNDERNTLKLCAIDIVELNDKRKKEKEKQTAKSLISEVINLNSLKQHLLVF